MGKIGVLARARQAPAKVSFEELKTLTGGNFWVCGISSGWICGQSS